MTTFTLDRPSNRIVALYQTAAGHQLRSLATVTVDEYHAGVDLDLLCRTMTELSRQLWDAYSNPPTASSSITEMKERTAVRRTFGAMARILDVLKSQCDGQEFDLAQFGLHEDDFDGAVAALTTTTHDLAMQLVGLAGHPLCATVLAEVSAEIRAVEQAERGRFTGRGAQATVLSRAEAAELQVETAEALFQANPLVGLESLANLNPTCASIAAARWFGHAAAVAADVAKVQPWRIPGYFVPEHEEMELPAQPVQTTVIAALHEHGLTADHVVLNLIRDAQLVERGYIPNLQVVVDLASTIGSIVDHFPDLRTRRSAIELLPPYSLTYLDVREPAPDLLRILVDGIALALSVFYEGIRSEQDLPVVDGQRLRHPTAGSLVEFDDPNFPEAMETLFCDRVRAHARVAKEAQ